PLSPRPLPPPRPTLFPYTTLFRSGAVQRHQHPVGLSPEQSPGGPADPGGPCRVGAGRTDHHRADDVKHRTIFHAFPSPPTPRPGDRKSTRLNSSHVKTSYAVFCLK